MEPNEAASLVEALLIQLELEFASAPDEPRFVVPTEHGAGIIIEFVPFGESVCAALIVPLLREVCSPETTGYELLADEQNQILLGKLCYDRIRRVLEVRAELIPEGLDSARLDLVLGALSQHSIIAERMEVEFGGNIGPSYEELLTGA